MKRMILSFLSGFIALSILLTGAFSFFAPPAEAVPVAPVVLTHVQKDGTVVYYRPNGDEIFYYMTDSNGDLAAFAQEPVMAAMLNKSTTDIQVGDTELLVAMMYREGEVIVVIAAPPVNDMDGPAYSEAVWNQAKAFADKYELVLLNTYPAIARSSGSSIIYLHSEHKSTNELIQELSSDTNVMSVNRNYIVSIDPINLLFTWSSSNTDVATVSELGLVTAVSPGVATITVTWEGLPMTCEVTVVPSVDIPIPHLTLTPITTTIRPGQTEQLFATVVPAYTPLTWRSSNASVAAVSGSGLVTGISEGTAVIAVSTESGFTATCAVSVIIPPPPPPLPPLPPLTIEVGITEQIAVTGIPAETPLMWGSSNISVATVSASGLVTGISPGVAIITITMEDGGYTTTCAVTVVPPVTIPKIKAEDALGGTPPNGAIFGNNGELLIYENLEGLNQDKIILRDDDLAEGWSIKDFNPKSSNGWNARFISEPNAAAAVEENAIAVRFTGEASGTVEVTIISESGEERLFPVVFTGVNGSGGNDNDSGGSGGGCNALNHGMLGFALMFALLKRRLIIS